jgi:hypothetical protein
MKSKEEILKDYHYFKNDSFFGQHIKPSIINAMETYKQQETEQLQSLNNELAEALKMQLSIMEYAYSANGVPFTTRYETEYNNAKSALDKFNSKK